MSKIIQRVIQTAGRWHLSNVHWSKAGETTSPILWQLSYQLKRELYLRLSELLEFTDPLTITTPLHITIDNLANAQAAVEQKFRSSSIVRAEDALNLIDEQIEHTNAILQIGAVSNSVQATTIASRTLNLLFCTRQTVKQKFSVITPLIDASNQNANSLGTAETKLLPVASATKNSDIQRLVISSSLLYQLHHSLFPAEKMMVGAGKRNGSTISVEAIFEVTGKASAVHVQADSNSLGRALIAMSETDTYFAWWIHSHPGRGREGTFPSGTDLNQEADWLKDYSSQLVNAIMVEDRFIRFWGKAIEEKRVAIEVIGTGVKRMSETEYLYQLEY